MLGAIGKYVGGKVLVATLAVASVVVVIWYWRLPPEARDQLWGVIRGALVWAGFVAVLPWASFFVPARAVRAESNLVSALVLLSYLLVDIAFALYLTGGHLGTRWQSGLLLVGFGCAGVYNLVVCEFLAQRSQDSG